MTLIREFFERWMPRKPAPVSVRRTGRKIENSRSIPLADRSQWGRKLASGEFVTTVEIAPPRGWEPQHILDAARVLKDNHVDAVNIPDGPRAITRMSAQHLSILIHQQIGIEPILHYTCRDRNLLGMMADMLGLYAVGIRNLLLITGDPLKMGDFPNAAPVFDVDSIGLTRMVHHLNQGIDPGGNPIGKPTGYVIGVGLNPNAMDMEREIQRFEQKVAAGADFAITQPLFDIDGFLRFREKIAHLRIPIIAGIWPLVSAKNAEFMNSELPGAMVPAGIIDRIRAAKTKEEALQEGLAITREMVRQLRDHVQGIQISAPLGKIDFALSVLDILKH
ncbi:MAG: methylenetetrahydrofolate reductase [Candidatus Omnitrophota bacterium]